MRAAHARINTPINTVVHASRAFVGLHISAAFRLRRQWNDAVADLGGGTAGPCPPPPLLKYFSINAPPFCTCAPPPLLKP